MSIAAALSSTNRAFSEISPTTSSRRGDSLAVSSAKSSPTRLCCTITRRTEVCAYAYPKVQFKVLDRTAHLIGLAEGAVLVTKLWAEVDQAANRRRGSSSARSAPWPSERATE